MSPPVRIQPTPEPTPTAKPKDEFSLADQGGAQPPCARCFGGRSLWAGSLGRWQQPAQRVVPITVPATDANTKAIAYVRIGVGALFLIFGEYKVFGTQFTLGGGFQGWINRFVADGAYPFMVPVLRGFVLDHGTAIAFFVAYGEFAIGLALVLGLLVRSASIFGGVYMLALLFASNYPGPGAAPWQYFGASLDHSVLALCFGAFVLGRPADVFSVRSVLRRWSGRAA